VTLRWRDWTSGATFEPRDPFNVRLNRPIEWSVNRPWRRRRLRKLRQLRRVDQILRMSNLAAARKWLPGNPLQVFADNFEDTRRMSEIRQRNIRAAPTVVACANAAEGAAWR
jgi:hypothetical protein